MLGILLQSDGHGSMRPLNFDMVETWSRTPPKFVTMNEDRGFHGQVEQTSIPAVEIYVILLCPNVVDNRISVMMPCHEALPLSILHLGHIPFSGTRKMLLPPKACSTTSAYYI
jgi:hypothetical protein